MTSPPYFAGKEYEESLGEQGVPGSYFEYLELLKDVFFECKRALEPGGRIAVNVANLGRRPYRSLSSDVAGILSELGLLLRGEIVWLKGRAAGGSCAWGTFQRPSNPVLRDVTERIVVASKGRFDRALSVSERRARGLPCKATISRDEFLDATTDLWEIPPESATRVGHPAPFPIELPRRLIDLYTYEDDVVLDPFIGSGTTAVAAKMSGRHFLGYDTDATYCERARKRVAAARREPPAVSEDASEGLTGALRDGLLVTDVAATVLAEAGFSRIRPDAKLGGMGVEVSFAAEDATGREWAFELAGAFSLNRQGLRRSDALWKALGKAGVVSSAAPGTPFVILTTHPPSRNSQGHLALAATTGPAGPVLDVIEFLSDTGRERLGRYATSGPPPPP